MLQTVGSCEQRLFGLTPAERLTRQMAGSQSLLVADSSAVLSDAAIDWLQEHPGTILTSPGSRPLAVIVDETTIGAARVAIEGGNHSFPAINPAGMPDMFVRKLRRRDKLLVRSLDEQSVGTVERALFDNVYKGVTDLVTKYVWPLPAFWITWLCARIGIVPNAATSAAIVLTVAAALLWTDGQLVAGMLCAWAMTFLDTVDGKLARVTVTSSRLGDHLDHLTDVIHPPIWWLSLALGIGQHEPAANDDLLWRSCIVILLTYVIGRLLEVAFKLRIGYNCYMWQRFDSRFRLIVSRRNIILLLMSVGLVFGAVLQAFVACAVWSVASTIIQYVRYVQASRAARSGSVPSWLM